MASTPRTTSSDYDAMLPYWELVEAILGGAEAMKEAGQTYLPKPPNESSDDYDYRLQNAKFTNIYADVVSTLAGKPFGEEVGLSDDATDVLKALAEDIDGRGNHLHVFAQASFTDGINYAVDWIMVDYTRPRGRADGRPLSLAEEREQGLRPYWVHVPAKRMLAVYSDVVAGKEVIVHARIEENITVRVGFEEVEKERVRVLNREPVEVDGQIVAYAPATFTLYEKSTQTRRGAQTESWDVIDEGPVSIGIIPLVPFVVGRRMGGGWQVNPPMRPAAELQIEHYQQETALKSIKELTAYPMLTGNGVSPPLVDGAPAAVPVGPKAVLYAPPSGDNNSHGEWNWLEPSADSMKFLASEVKVIEEQLRELGRQPLVAASGITVVGAAFATQKANSALKAWALGLKDALEQAFVITCLWLKETRVPTIQWNLEDLDLDMQDDDGSADLLSMRDKGDLSQDTLWSEMKRRGKLSSDFDPDKERERLIDEAPGEDAAQDAAAALPPDPANDPQQQDVAA